MDLQKKLRALLVRFNRGHATISLSAFLDLADSDDWSAAITPGGAILPVLLPFVLATSKPEEVYRDLKGLPYCNEFWLQIQVTSGGWIDVRNLVVAATMKKFIDPNA
jgi:hypothetical protein